ncbi:hypothetical protein TruAng_008624 [Truncatella angustata]|nr:hypothetical protein TruAng_008624 [Truncatella angustata]
MPPSGCGFPEILQHLARTKEQPVDTCYYRWGPVVARTAVILPVQWGPKLQDQDCRHMLREWHPICKAHYGPEHRELDDHTFWFLFFDSALAWQGLEAAEKEIGRQQFAISTPTASEENFATATIHGSQAGTNEIAEFHPPRYPAKLCRALPASTSTTSNPSTATSTTKPHAHLQCHEPFEG